MKTIQLRLTCEHCGQPISKTSRDFGMDCANDCGRKHGALMRVAYGPIDRPLSLAERLAVKHIRANSPQSHHELWQRCADDFAIYGNSTCADSVAELVGNYISWAHSFEKYVV